MQENGLKHKVIGFDPGIDRLGWAVVASTGLRSTQCLAQGLITTNRKETIAARLKEIYDDVTSLLVQHSPEAMYIEELYFATNKTTAMTISEVRGILKLCSAQKGIPLVEIHPMKVKKYIVGTGKATKKQIHYMVQHLFSLSTELITDDVADAVAIAYLGALDRCHILVV